MSEIKSTITEQLQQLQVLMQRMAFRGFVGRTATRNPHRGQGRVLAIMKMKPEISQRELNYLLGMSKQSLAELLSKLDKSGYITREPSEEDKRVTLIKLTEEGMKIADDMDDEETEASKILNCLNEEELTKFSDYLDRIIKQYEERFPEEDFEERRKIMEAFVSRYRPSHGRSNYDRRGSRGEGGGHRHHGEGRSRSDR